MTKALVTRWKKVNARVDTWPGGGNADYVSELGEIVYELGQVKKELSTIPHNIADWMRLARKVAAVEYRTNEIADEYGR